MKKHFSCIYRIDESATLFENCSKCRIWILAFSTNFCPIKTDLSGNTVWPQASGFQKLAKMDHFWHFKLTFVHSKCKRSSLRSQCLMRLFLWFSSTVGKTIFLTEKERKCDAQELSQNLLRQFFANVWLSDTLFFVSCTAAAHCIKLSKMSHSLHLKFQFSQKNCNFDIWREIQKLANST